MKKIVLFASVLVFSLAAMGQSKTDDNVKFNTDKHDFGKIKQGTPVTYFFEIKNTGDKPIVVENASASCGCTVPEKPEKPINPGATGKLKVQYNAATVGPFKKDIFIKLAGIEQPKTVQIVGEVVAAEDNSSAKKTDNK
jgi:archaellum component FlaG (FlaF/FlaG flagellin family)